MAEAEEDAPVAPPDPALCAMYPGFQLNPVPIIVRVKEQNAPPPRLLTPFDLRRLEEDVRERAREMREEAFLRPPAHCC